VFVDIPALNDLDDQMIVVKPYRMNYSIFRINRPQIDIDEGILVYYDVNRICRNKM